MIYDCFIFNDEIELLEMRLYELAGVVDRHVLVEASATHQDTPRLPVFPRIRHTLGPLAGRVRPVLIDFPRLETPWDREVYQRNAILTGLEGCAADDLILVSDADEIPHPDAIRQAAEWGGTTGFVQDLSYYYLNYRQRGVWVGTKAAPYSSVARLTPNTLRWGEVERTISPGGWHFSYCGGADRIRAKLQSFHHAEYNAPEFTDPEHIAAILTSGQDLFGREVYAFRLEPLDESYPRYLLEHSERLRAWVAFAPYQDALAADE